MATFDPYDHVVTTTTRPTDTYVDPLILRGKFDLRDAPGFTTAKVNADATAARTIRTMQRNRRTV